MTLSSRNIDSNSAISVGVAQKRTSVENSAKAAKDFEAVLLSMIFEKFEESISSSEESTPGGDTLRDLGAQQLASAVSSAGGIGIARLIAPYLENTTQCHQQPKASRRCAD